MFGSGRARVSIPLLATVPPARSPWVDTHLVCSLRFGIRELLRRARWLLPLYGKQVRVPVTLRRSRTMDGVLWVRLAHVEYRMVQRNL